MNDLDLDAIVEAKLAEQLEARLRADRERVRAEVVDQIRREASARHYDRINAKHAVEGPLAGLTPAQHEARLRAMQAGVQRDMEKMDKANSRVIEGTLLHQKSRAALTPGSEAFKVK